MFTPQPKHGQRTNEDLFFDYYQQILEWALQLTQMDRPDAEDLIQDLYVHITNIGFSLAEVEDTRPYLFKILRNLYVSGLRQKGKIPVCDISALDYDSLEKGLGAVDWRDLFLVRTDLKQICEFACERKKSARGASIFLLRFFLGYYPSEVMKVAQVTRVGVEKSLQFMRREMHLHLDRRDRPTPRKAPDADVTRKAVDSSHALFVELRQIIFNSCEGPCFPPKSLDRYYREESPDRLSTAELGHLVSCKSCLDAVNVLLGLPKLDERSPDDTIGRDNSSGSAGSGEPKLSVRKTKRKPDTRERNLLARSRTAWFEHRPLLLEIAVNGETRTSQRITAEVSEFYLKLNRAESPEFIELFSEQRIRLSYLHILEPSHCHALEQRQTVELSDGRSLDVSLSFASDVPTVHVVYRDPLFIQVASEVKTDESADTGFEHAIPQRQDSGESRSVVKFPPRGNLLSVFFPLRALRMHPLLATGLTLAFSSILCLLLWLHLVPPVTAGNLLHRAQAQDASATIQATTRVIYQKVRISSHGHSFDRAIYRDPARKRRPKQWRLDPQEQQVKQNLTLAGADWDEPLSPANFSAWRDNQSLKRDAVTRTGRDLLTLTTTSASPGKVISESLTVRESDFHPVDRIIELRDQGTVEIAELNYDVMPWGQVNQDWFEPALAGMVTDAPGLLPALPAHSSHVLSSLALNEAELEVRYALHQAGADVGEPINAHIDNAAQVISVSGIVPSEAQKRELVASLSQLPHVAVHLQTEEEAAKAALQNSFATASRAQPKLVAQHSPIEQELLQHFGDPSAVESFSSHATMAADGLVAHAWALRRLSARYGAPNSTKEGALTPSSRQLLTMRRDHLKAMSDAASELSALLLPVVAPLAEPGPVVLPQQSLFEGAEEVQGLTAQLLSGPSAKDPAQNTDPHKTAQSLLAALHSLATTLKEQP